MNVSSARACGAAGWANPFVCLSVCLLQLCLYFLVVCVCDWLSPLRVFDHPAVRLVLTGITIDAFESSGPPHRWMWRCDGWGEPLYTIWLFKCGLGMAHLVLPGLFGPTID